MLIENFSQFCAEFQLFGNPVELMTPVTKTNTWQMERSIELIAPKRKAHHDVVWFMLLEFATMHVVCTVPVAFAP